MKKVILPTCYYQQFDAQFDLDVPAEGYGGWKKADLELSITHTAMAVMHAWDCGSRDTYPGWHRAVEYIPRANAIGRDVFPELLSTVRASGMKLYHIVPENDYYSGYPGYKPDPEEKKDRNGEDDPAALIDIDGVYERLRKFRTANVFPGEHNCADIAKGFKNMVFMKEAEPVGEEGIAKNGKQLYALCQRDSINHLIYVGFAINWCILASPGGMVEMSGKGLLCSTIRQAVTAVENKETARRELCKEIALWRVALAYGFIYELEDFLNAIRRCRI